jgi:class 3 adenylate cyclase
MERKLTAILSADVEGYSRLMGEDEEATIRTLTFYRQVITPLIQGHRGRVIDSPGDNLLAEFGSVVDAVQCAVVIQTTLRAENANLPQNRRMVFRIGINLGDVIVDGERIYGDGVNIAARMEGLAEGGGICVSGMVFEQVKGKVTVNFEDLGPQQVKNIGEPIRAYRAVLGSGTESARPQQKVEAPRQDLREGSDRYDRLTSRLGPLLYRGIDDVLQRHKKTLKWGGRLTFLVYAPINGFYRVVGGTIPAEAPGRQNYSRVSEGIRGFLAERKVAGYVRANLSFESKESKRQVFDRNGEVLAEFPLGRVDGILGRSGESKWHYYSPIFEKSVATPWSTREVGLFSVFATADDADTLFRSAKFQRMVDSVATEVSPYLDAIQLITGEEKL